MRKKRHNWFEKCARVPPKVVIHVHHVDEEGFGGDVLPVFYLFIFFSIIKNTSSLSKSFIFLCIMIVFLVIFWPGRCILRTIQIEEFNVKVSKPIQVFSGGTEHFSLECMTCLSSGFSGLLMSSSSSFFILQCYSGYCEHKTFRKLNIFIERGKPEHQMTHL